MRFSTLACAAVCVVACQKAAVDQGGLNVTVIVDPSVKADCIGIAAVKISGGQEETSTPLAARQAQLSFGVAGDAQLNGDISIVARGFLGTDCAKPGALNAQSAPVMGTLKPGVVNGTVTVELTGALDDADGDGYRAKDKGGTDCDDANAAINPGEVELCSDGLDNDCSGAADCADRAACDTHSCADGNACSTGATCAGGVCQGGTAGCTASLGPCFQSPGTCSDAGTCTYAIVTGAACDAGTCRSDGSCVGGETICDDGVDNDMNGRTDCLDSSCLGQHCNDGDPCTQADVCLADGGCAGAPLACNTPPSGACVVQDAGTCSAGVCQYLTAVGASCDDNNPCTQPDVCLANGSCAGTAKTCTAPPDGGCGATSGTCNPANGQCQFGNVSSGTPCDDLNACTTTDQCNASGMCAGMAVSCTALPCKTSMGCQPNGTCAYANESDGTPCAGGTCTGGMCTSVFPYTPSNFDPATLAAGDWSGMIHLTGTCALGFTTTGAGMFTQTCGLTGLPAPKTVTLSDSTQAVLLPFGGLQMDNMTSFRIVGDKPVILAVKGDANVGGTINVSSTTTESGAGANAASCGNGVGGAGASASGSDTGTAFTAGGGAGGAGFGSAGSNGGQSAAGGSGTVGGAGALNGNSTLVPLRGGCAGGVGGPSVDNMTCPAGISGGAVQLSVAGTLTLSGRVAASGGGARTGPDGYHTPGNGGGGGCGAGSGGAILLEGKVVTLMNAGLLTNGGAGGEGGGTTNPGNDGSSGSSTMVAIAQGGTGGNSFGGQGANGASGQVGAGGFAAAGTGAGGAAAGSGEGGGGGGAGGVGRIRVNAFMTCMSTTPAVSGDISFSMSCP